MCKDEEEEEEEDEEDEEGEEVFLFLLLFVYGLAYLCSSPFTVRWGLLLLVLVLLSQVVFHRLEKANNKHTHI